MTTLKLNVAKSPFEVMKTGEKLQEYRVISKWMTSRLYNKDGTPRDYDFIQITNGYGKDRPTFTAKYEGFTIENNINKIYSNGLKVVVNDTPTYVIFYKMSE